jgi:hypothetical protein
MAAKVLITGLANTGKTTLLKSLKDALVISRDGKPFSLPISHFNVPDYEHMEDLIAMIEEKASYYESQKGTLPSTIAFDSVSRIFSDSEVNCMRGHKGYEVWSNINREINLFLNYLNTIQTHNTNLVLIAHAAWDAEAKKFIETCKGSFAKIGGFLSTVDYAINIDILGSKRIITHRGNNLSRTLLTDIPDKQDANTFNLQEYIDKLITQSVIAEKWSI